MLFRSGLRHFINVGECRFQIHQWRKTVVTLCDIHSAKFTGKVIDFVKEIFMNSFQRSECSRLQGIQHAVFKKFSCFLLADALLYFCKLSRTGDTKFVLGSHIAPPLYSYWFYYNSRFSLYKNSYAIVAR